MGASIGMMSGMNKVLGRKAAVAVLGDSTFFHSGVTPLIDARYNGTDGLVLVLDNRTTAMTGHQGHPGSGLHADGTQGPDLDIQRLCEGIGVRCTTVDALDGEALREAVEREIATPGLGVLVAQAPCRSPSAAPGGRHHRRRALQPVRPLPGPRLSGPGAGRRARWRSTSPAPAAACVPRSAGAARIAALAETPARRGGRA